MGTLKVLVVDDDCGMRETLADVLSDLGHEVIMARDGYEAIQEAYKGTIEIALIDVRMPGLDGVETFMRIKEQLPRFSAYLMTAFASGNQLSLAKGNGILGVLEKPLDMDHLVSVLDTFTGDRGDIRQSQSCFPCLGGEVRHGA